MSIVSVHGPLTFGSKAVVDAGPVVATVNPANGLQWTYAFTDPTTRVAADFDWAFPPDGTPATQADSKGPITVTYAAAGAKTATLTVSGAGAGANPHPPAGAYPIAVTAVAGVGPRMAEQSVEGGDEEPETDPETGYPPVTEPYDPGEFTVAEVTEYAQTLDVDGVKAVLAAEEEGKARTTLVTALGELLPYDPADWTVDEVKEYVEAYPDEREAVLEAERAGKARTTLLSHLEAEPEEES